MKISFLFYTRAYEANAKTRIRPMVNEINKSTESRHDMSGPRLEWKGAILRRFVLTLRV